MLKNKNSLKIFSIFLSILIWFYVVGSTKIQRVKVFPVFFDVPSEYALESISHNTILIRLKGPRFIIDSFLKKDVLIKIPIKELLKNNQRSYTYSIENLEDIIPFGLEIMNKEIREIKYTIAKKKTKTLPIKLQFSEQIHAEFNIKNIQFSKDKVTVAGTKQQLAGLKEIKSELITIKKIKKNKYFEVRLENPLPFTQLGHKNTTVRLEMGDKFVQKELELPIKIKNNRLYKTPKVRTAKIKVEGAKIDMDRAIEKLINVYIDYNNKSDSKKSFLLNVDLPIGIKLIEITPKRVEVIKGNE